jgi:superfamily II DNA or RNA helicase
MGLEEIFETIVYHKSISDIIKKGWLCPVTGYRVKSDTNLSEISTIMGNFSENELSAAVNNPVRNSLVIKSYMDHGSDKKAIVFAVDVAHAHDLALLFRNASISAEAITSITPRTERQRMIESFRKGELQVLTNRQVLTEGFDEPKIEVIIVARPTQSSLLYTHPG